MEPTKSSPHSTRLENLSFDPRGAQFDLDGRTVRLQGPEHAPSIDALQAFYRQAAADYHARASAPRPGWLARLWAWAGRVFGGSAAPAPAALALSQAPGPATPPVSPARARPEPARAMHPEPAPLTAATASAQASPAAQPMLRAVFADKEGLHLIWQPAHGRSSAAEKDSPRDLKMTYGLDSALAKRLEDCYGHLAGLGYKVVGLELLKDPPGPSPVRAPEKQAQAQVSLEPQAPAPVPAENKEPAAPKASRARTRPAPEAPLPAPKAEPPEPDPQPILPALPEP